MAGEPIRLFFVFGKHLVNNSVVSRTDDTGLTRLSEAIRDTLVQHQITTRNVVVGLPTKQVFVTVSKFDDVPGADLHRSLKFRVDNIVPGSAEDFKVDYAILDDDIRQSQQASGDQKQESQTKQTDVLVCAIKKEVVERQLEMLESINLNVLAFEPDALAITRTVASQDSTINILVDVGFRSTDVVVVARNQPRLVTSLEFGVSHVVRQVINVLSVDEPTALDMVFRLGLKGDESQKKMTVATIESFDLLVNTLNKSIDFVKTKYAQYQIGKIMLWGDVIYVPGLLDFLECFFQFTGCGRRYLAKCSLSIQCS